MFCKYAGWEGFFHPLCMRWSYTSDSSLYSCLLCILYCIRWLEAVFACRNVTFADRQVCVQYFCWERFSYQQQRMVDENAQHAEAINNFKVIDLVQLVHFFRFLDNFGFSCVWAKLVFEDSQILFIRWFVWKEIFVIWKFIVILRNCLMRVAL